MRRVPAWHSSACRTPRRAQRSSRGSASSETQPCRQPFCPTTAHHSPCRCDRHALLIWCLGCMSGSRHQGSGPYLSPAACLASPAQLSVQCECRRQPSGSARSRRRQLRQSVPPLRHRRRAWRLSCSSARSRSDACWRKPQSARAKQPSSAAGSASPDGYALQCCFIDVLIKSSNRYVSLGDHRHQWVFLARVHF